MGNFHKAYNETLMACIFLLPLCLYYLNCAFNKVSYKIMNSFERLSKSVPCRKLCKPNSFCLSLLCLSMYVHY